MPRRTRPVSIFATGEGVANARTVTGQRACGGATVVTAHSAAAGYAMLVAQRPDVLLSDIGMPEEDGLTFIRRVRSLDAARIPAVAITAYASAADRSRALVAGFNRHVTKPIEPSEVVALVGTLAPKRAA